ATRKGTDLVAAGYVIYGSGTVLVLGTDAGVHGFTLDPSVGEFFLSHPHMRIPKGRIYSTNEGYSRDWHPGMVAYVDSIKDQPKRWRARYIGSLVADFHRNMLKGGIFLYPATVGSPSGKLRLLYEAYPLAYLAEKAGGAATDGSVRILDKVAVDVHERTPLIIGDIDEVARATEFTRLDPPFSA
ncbi:MAG: fructose-1,6-bisphosphatase I, partial [Kiritimatiellia bacterium]